MLKIGITGGIGSGKTTVCKIFQQLGVPVYNADIEAKKLLDFNEAVKSEIIAIFGNNIIAKNGYIDRVKLGAIVFNNKEKLTQLNSIVHPAVAQHFTDWINNNKTKDYIIKEAAILFESGSYKAVDKIITVIAPLELRIQRSMERDNTDRSTIEQRIKNQMSDEEKIKMSHFVIENNESQLLIPQVLKIHQELINN